MGLSNALGSQFLTTFPFQEIRLIVLIDTVTWKTGFRVDCLAEWQRIKPLAVA